MHNNNKLFLSKPNWEVINTVTGYSNEQNYSKHFIFIFGAQHELEKYAPILNLEKLGKNLTHPQAQVRAYVSEKSSVDSYFIDVVSFLTSELKEIALAVQQDEQCLVQVLGIEFTGLNTLFGLSSLFKSLQIEHPNIKGQVIEFNDLQSSEQACLAFMSDILSNAKHSIENYYTKYNAEQCQVQKWHGIEHAIHTPSQDQLSNITWQENSSYIISGGLGGIGKILCRSILQSTKSSQVVLLGQREMSPALLDDLGHLDATGRTQYYQIDLSNLTKVEDLIRDISKFSRPLKGVMHAAGCVQDSLLINKSIQDIERVLKPKVAGVVNLDLATSDVTLDFFIAFSSLASVSGNAGQLDYACANGFVDSYIQYRSSLCEHQHRRGKSLSINWPIWAEGGMKVSQTALKAMNLKAGIVPLPTNMALDVINFCLTHDIKQALPVYGDTTQFLASFGSNTKTSHVSSNQTDKAQFSKVLMILKRVLAEETKEPIESINIDKPFEKQGIDSVMAMAMTDKLEGHFGTLSKTLFFEHQNLKDLAKHLQHNVITTVDDDREYEPDSPIFDTQQTASVLSSYRDSDIAIIGLSGRFPDAPTISEFWHNLERGHDAIGMIPSQRWDAQAWFDDTKSNPLKSYCKWGGFLGDVTLFDAEFFDVTAAQALVMDPQERLFLETVCLLMEQTGHSASILKHRYNHKIGTYVGSMTLPYQQVNTLPELSAVTSLATHSVIANRVSYFFDLQGPSVAVDTMCSSALSAVDFACNALRNGDCSLAIAGAVNLSLERNKYIGLSRAGALASHEWSRSFSDGDGYIPAEGVGAVLLKPLRDAERDRDAILAVIKATSTNHGGRSNGFAVPNVNVQAKLIADNIQRADVDPRTINYVECASNGSALGDPIEITALKKAFSTFTKDHKFCAIGSVKASIGHAEAASGMSQLAKILLQIKHGTLVKTLLSEKLNARIDLANSPFYLQTETVPWHRVTLQHNGQEVTYPRRAAISSFGDGGSNAHLILEEYLANQVHSGSLHRNEEVQVFPISARTHDELQKSISNLANYISTTKTLDLKALSDTLRIGRNAMTYRIAVICNSREVLLNTLQSYLLGESLASEVLLSHDKGSIPLESLTSLREADEDELFTLCQDKTLELLGCYWVNGVDVPWVKLVANDSFEFLTDLPSYPFTKTHYWVGDYQSQDTQVVNVLAPTAPSVHKGNSLLQILKEMVSQLISIDAGSIDVHRNLAEIGFDSLKFTLLCEQLNERFTLQILPTVFYQFGSLKALEKFLQSEHNVTISVNDEVHSEHKEKQVEKESIAICGASVRLPQANDIDKMWALLCAGSDTVTEVPSSRFDWQVHYGDIHLDPSKSLCQWHAQLDNIEQFDPLFFEISPLEAATLDPRARLLLESAWHALEDAAIGITPNVGVFIGAEPGDYDALAKQQYKQVFNSDAMLASRIAYFLNFQGPVFTLNTTCSSGLMAAHQACQSLRAHECDVALVGAANLNITPRSFMIMSNAGALAIDGKCKAFDSAADGVVLGEAVVVLVLKRLSEALSDGQPIYALIEGSKVNNDGKTNGITAPSEQAQSALLTKVYKEFNIDAQQIGHIVTHGTGTRLGDSIEINSLHGAFQNVAGHIGGCGLSSTKVNFGHSLAASGLVSLVALAQSIKMGTIPPATHLRQLNDYVDWQSSPFFVPTTAQPWRLKGRRLGAVSAFGMTGTNVHMVLGEAPVQQGIKERTSTPQLLLFSAKSAMALRHKLQDMANFFNEKSDIENDLPSIAHTLIAGRHHFKYRCAVIVHMQQDMSALFNTITSQSEQIEGVHWGSEHQETADSRYLDTLSKLSQTMNEVARNSLLIELAQLYCAGATPVSEHVSNTAKIRVRLPVYPFEHNSYWLDDLPSTSINNEYRNSHQAHPLLVHNISRLAEQAFVTPMSVQDVLLEEHRIGGIATLPGAVHIEMAIASLKYATNAVCGVRLSNLYWQRPLQIKHGIQNVCISLSHKSNDSWSFKTHSDQAGEDVEYCCGSLQLLSNKSEYLDRNAVLERCQLESVNISQFYESFSASGVEYGKAFQCVQRIDLGQGELIAQLQLDSRFEGDATEYAIHPTLLDGALQTCQLLLNEEATQSQGALLYAIDCFEQLSQCPNKVLVWAKQAKSSDLGVLKFDLMLSDEHGNICAKLIGVCARAHQHANHHKTPLGGGITTLTGRWKTLTSSPQTTLLAADCKVVVLSEQPQQAISELLPQATILPIHLHHGIQQLQEALLKAGEIEHILVVFASKKTQQAFDLKSQSKAKQSLVYLFSLTKALQSLNTSNKLTITLVTQNAYQVHDLSASEPGQAMLHGLVNVVAKECPHWHVTGVDLEDKGQLSLVLQSESELPAGEFAYREGNWYQKQLVQVATHMPVKYQGLPQTTEFKKNGVYLLIGGSGGIGRVVTKHLHATYQAQVIWLGRSQQQDVLSKDSDEFANLGSKLFYYQCDATDLGELKRVSKDIHCRFGRINGVIQSAIGELDSSIATMNEAQFLTALSPKFDVSLNAALAFSDLSLDFMLLFSSLASFACESGTASYSAGGIFQDEFAKYLNSVVDFPVKVLNWGVWDRIGVANAITNESRNRLAMSGVGVISASQGVQALEQCLAMPLVQLAAIKLNDSIAQVFGDGAVTDKYLYHSCDGPIEMCLWLSDIRQLAHDRFNMLKQTVDEQDTKIQKDIDSAIYQQVFSLLSQVLFADADVCSVESLIESQKIASIHAQWLAHMLALLEQNGYVQSTEPGGNTYYLVEQDTSPEHIDWQLQSEQWRQIPHFKAQVNALNAVFSDLVSVLKGRKLGTEVLFPGGSDVLVAGLYQNNLLSDYFNDLVTSVVERQIQQKLKGCENLQLRILEVGAGTGATSRRVLKALQSYQLNIAEYLFTDISPALVNQANTQLSDLYPFLKCQPLDIERTLTQQDIDIGQYDIVIATNVIHATSRVRESLQNIKGTMKNQGLFILNESISNKLFAHLTFGLLDGWWAFKDGDLRQPGSPLLDVATWLATLKSEGFERCEHLNVGVEELGQEVFVAYSNGVVKQNAPQGAMALSKTSNVQQITVHQEQVMRTHEIQEKEDVSYQPAAETLIKQVISTALRIPISKLDSQETFDKYGIDSILVVKLTNLLTEKLGQEVSSTLFFEYQTIAQLAEYLQSEFADTIVSQPFSEDMQSRQKPLDNPVTTIQQAPILTNDSQDIAVIGLAGRYPKASNIQQLWDNLCEGKNCIDKIPSSRWSWQEYYSEERGKHGSIYSKWGGFVDDVDQFDSLFFKISPRDAQAMDPQGRLFLQEAYHCIEDAGYTPNNLSPQRNVGVFVGITNSTYPTGADYSSVPNRVSYCMNLFGPSVAFDTACSSSLTATHFAISSIRNGDCDCAIVGGVNLVLDPIHYIGLSAMTMLSDGPNCKAFGAGADGFVDAEGVGVMLLKPLAQALEDRDHVYGVIKASAINSGGHTHGYTVPNPNAQQRLINDALRRSGINAETVSYLEAHGTGTLLGDPIEVKALTKAFKHDTKNTGYCAIGSIKSNIGHSESAAGIAGITKVLLQLKHKKLVPTLHAEHENPKIDFVNSPFVVQKQLSDWTRPTMYQNGRHVEVPRRAGLSSFGAGGANAHLIIEECLPVPCDEVEFSNYCVLLSARDVTRLQQRASQLLAWIKLPSNKTISLSSIAYTLQVGREPMPVRAGLLVSNRDELLQSLTNLASGANHAHIYMSDGGVTQSLSSLFEEAELNSVLRNWMTQGKFHQLVEAWVQGVSVDWLNLYDVHRRPHRISLPGYPFAPESHWVPRKDNARQGAFGLHPMVQHNISDLSASVKFGTTFISSEFFIKDHQVNGHLILPAAAYLEMLRASASLVWEQRADAMHQLAMTNLVWLMPMVVGADGLAIEIKVTESAASELSLTVHSHDEQTLYCQGNIRRVQPSQLETLDIAAIKSRCSHAVIDNKQCYEVYQLCGVQFGPSLRATDVIYSAPKEALAKLHLPAECESSLATYHLHPSIVDAALQAISGIQLLDEQGQVGGPLVPFALE
ncbi:SDR family NAD(P)-dependent oxidoreductase, partial [Pseudoalteromonas holothuriae]|uniref:SDR family NAD(P)-dependent oxidoreductase n=1 Tax=Pseudoalteromonas holothuriae TaxID=2963714 RepID=UPI0021BFEF55